MRGWRGWSARASGPASPGERRNCHNVLEECCLQGV